jgi:rod shape-determining protein MreD
VPSGLRRFALLLLAALLLLWLAGQLNQVLARFGVSAWVGGLLVVFPVLRAGPREGLALTLLTGLFCDAMTPVPFGLHAFMFAAAHVCTGCLRPRLPVRETLVGVVMALFFNLAFMLVLGVLHTASWPDPAIGWMRWMADLVLSQVVIVLVAPWYFALQLRILGLLDANWPEQPHRLQ